MGIWRSLDRMWRGGRSPSRINRRQAPINLRAIDAFYLEEGLPRVAWEKVDDAIEAAANASGPFTAHDFYCTAAEQWLSAMGAHLDPPHGVHESEHFILLIPGRADADLIVRQAEAASRSVQAALGDLASVPDTGKHVLIVMWPQENYYAYVSHFHPDTGEFGGSSGTCILDGYVHMVVNYAEHELDRVIAHELAHDLLAHRSVPTWLEEGIATTVEQRRTPNAGARAMLRDARRHQRYWRLWGVEHSCAGVRSAVPRVGRGWRTRWPSGCSPK